LPASGDRQRTRFAIEAQRAWDPSEFPVADLYSVSAGYFRTMRIPLLQGREFATHEGEGTARVAIISQTMARRYWPAEDPVGKRIKVGAQSGSGAPWVPIVGVVGDVKQFALDREPRSAIYVPLPQSPDLTMSLAVRTSVDPLDLVPGV